MDSGHVDVQLLCKEGPLERTWVHQFTLARLRMASEVKSQRLGVIQFPVKCFISMEPR